MFPADQMGLDITDKYSSPANAMSVKNRVVTGATCTSQVFRHIHPADLSFGSFPLACLPMYWAPSLHSVSAAADDEKQITFRQRPLTEGHVYCLGSIYSNCI